MKTIFYLSVLAVLIITGCKQKDENMNENAGSVSLTDRSLVNVSRIAGIGKVEPEGGITELAAITGGIVKEIYGTEGKAVKKGEPLLLLDNELEFFRAEQIRKQYQGLRIQKVTGELAVREAEERLNNRSRLLASVKALSEKGAETARNLNDLETEVKTLTIQLERSRNELALLQVRLEELGNQLKIAETELSRKTLRAPFDGILLEMIIRQGSALSEYETFAVAAPEGRTIVTTEVDELFADRLTAGLKAEIRFIGSDTPVATGTVFFVSPYLKNKSLFSKNPAEQEDRLVREVKILLEGNTKLIYNSKVESIIIL